MSRLHLTLIHSFFHSLIYWLIHSFTQQMLMTSAGWRGYGPTARLKGANSRVCKASVTAQCGQDCV